MTASLDPAVIHVNGTFAHRRLINSGVKITTTKHYLPQNHGRKLSGLKTFTPVQARVRKAGMGTTEPVKLSDILSENLPGRGMVSDKEVQSPALYAQVAKPSRVDIRQHVGREDVELSATLKLGQVMGQDVSGVFSAAGMWQRGSAPEHAQLSETYVQWFQWGVEAEVCIGIFMLCVGLTIASLHYAGALQLYPETRTADDVLAEVYAKAQEPKVVTSRPSVTPKSTLIRGYIRVPRCKQHLPQQLTSRSAQALPNDTTESPWKQNDSTKVSFWQWCWG